MFILVASGQVVRDILLEGYDLGMNSGEYAFVGIELVKSRLNSGDFSWYQPGDRRNKQAREMFEALLMVNVRVPVTGEYSSFVHEVAKKAVGEFGSSKSEPDVSFCLNLSNSIQFEKTFEFRCMSSRASLPRSTQSRQPSMTAS